MCSKLDFSGGRIEVLKTRASVSGWRVKCAQVNPSVRSDDTAATAHDSRASLSSRFQPTLSVIVDGAVAMPNRDSGREPERPESVDKASRAKPRSRADWKRRSGFFSRQRRTIFSSAGETFAFISPSSGGSSFKIALITSATEAPLKARRPLIISYRIIPKLKM